MGDLKEEIQQIQMSDVRAKLFSVALPLTDTEFEGSNSFMGENSPGSDQIWMLEEQS